MGRIRGKLAQGRMPATVLSASLRKRGAPTRSRVSGSVTSFAAVVDSFSGVSARHVSARAEAVSWRRQPSSPRACRRYETVDGGRNTPTPRPCKFRTRAVLPLGPTAGGGPGGRRRARR